MPPASESAATAVSGLTAMGVGLGWQEAAGGAAVCASADAEPVRERHSNAAALSRSVRLASVIFFPLAADGLGKLELQSAGAFDCEPARALRSSSRRRGSWS